jgi:hypothetical protein
MMSRPIQDGLGPDGRRPPFADGSQPIARVGCPEEGNRRAAARAAGKTLGRS